MRFSRRALVCTLVVGLWSACDSKSSEEPGTEDTGADSYADDDVGDIGQADVPLADSEAPGDVALPDDAPLPDDASGPTDIAQSDAPQSDAPTPDVPTPDVPTPDDVTPDVPSPDVPGPDDASGDDATDDAGEGKDPIALTCAPEPETWNRRPGWHELVTGAGFLPNYVEISKNFSVLKTLQFLTSAITAGMKALDDPAATLSGGPLEGWCLCDGAVACLGGQVDDVVSDLSTEIGNKLLILITSQLGVDGAGKAAWTATQNIGQTLVADLTTELTTLRDALGLTGPESLVAVTKAARDCFTSELKQAFPELLGKFQKRLAEAWGPMKEPLLGVKDYFKGHKTLADIATSVPTLAAKLFPVVVTFGTQAKALLDDLKALAANPTAYADAQLSQFEADVKQCIAAKFPDVPNPADTPTKVGAFVTAAHTKIKAAVEQVIVAWKAVHVQLEGLANAVLGGIANLGNISFWDKLFKQYWDSGGLMDQVKKCVPWLSLEACMPPEALDQDGNDPLTHLPPDSVGCQTGNLGAFVAWFPTDLHKQGAAKVALFVLKYTGILDKAQEWLKELTGKVGALGSKLLATLKNIEEVFTIIFEYLDRFTEGYHLGAYDLLRPALHHCVGYFGHGVYARMAGLAGGRVTVGGTYTSFNLSRRHRAQFRTGGFGIRAFDRTYTLVPSVEALMQIDGMRLWDPANPFGMNLGLPSIPAGTMGRIGFNHLASDDATPDDQSNDQGLMKPPGYTPGQDYSLGNLLFEKVFPAKYDPDPSDADPAATALWPRDLAPMDPPMSFVESDVAVLALGLNLPLETQIGPYQLLPIPVFPPFAYLVPYFQMGARVEWFHAADRFRGVIVQGITKSLPKTIVSDEVFWRDPSHDADHYPGHAVQPDDVTDDLGNEIAITPEIGADLNVGIQLARFLRIGITATIGLRVKLAVSANAGLFDLNRAVAELLERSNPPRDAPCDPIMKENAKRVCSNTLATFGGKTRSTQTFACDGVDGLDKVWYDFKTFLERRRARCDSWAKALSALFATKKQALTAEVQAWLDARKARIESVRKKLDGAIAALEVLAEAHNVAAVAAAVTAVQGAIGVMKSEFTAFKAELVSMPNDVKDFVAGEVKDIRDQLIAQMTAFCDEIVDDATKTLGAALGANQCESNGYCVLDSGEIVHDLTEPACLALAAAQPSDKGLCCYPTAKAPLQFAVTCGADKSDEIEKLEPVDLSTVYTVGTRAQCTTGTFTPFAHPDDPAVVRESGFDNIVQGDGAIVCMSTFPAPLTYKSACTQKTEAYGTDPVGYTIAFDNVPRVDGGAKWFPYSCVTQSEPEVTGWSGPGCHPLKTGFPSVMGCRDGEPCAAGETCTDGVCVPPAETAESDGECDPYVSDTACGAGRTCVRGACARACQSDNDCWQWESCEAGEDIGEHLCARRYGIPFAEEVKWLLASKENPFHTVATYALSLLEVTAYLPAGVSIGAELRVFGFNIKLTLFDWHKVFELAAINRAWYQPGLSADYTDMCYDSNADNHAYFGEVTNKQPELVSRYVDHGPTLEEFLSTCNHTLRQSGPEERYRKLEEAPNPDRIVNDFNGLLDFGADMAQNLWETRKGLCPGGLSIEDILKKTLEDPSALQCVWTRDDKTERQFLCVRLPGVLAADLKCPAPPSNVSAFLLPYWDADLGVYRIEDMLKDPTQLASASNVKDDIVNVPGVLTWLQSVSACIESKAIPNQEHLRAIIAELDGCNGEGAGGGGDHTGGKPLNWNDPGAGGDSDPGDKEDDPFGACCVTDVGCQDHVTEESCVMGAVPGESASWIKAGVCGPDTCGDKTPSSKDKKPYERDGVCCLRNPKGGAPCQVSHPFECEGCWYEVKTCGEVNNCDPSSTWLECPPSDGGPATGNDYPGGPDDPPPCESDAACAKPSQLYTTPCSELTPAAAACPKGMIPAVSCSDGVDTCGSAFTCARTTCKNKNTSVPPITPTCGDGTIITVSTCAAVTLLNPLTVTVVGGTVTSTDPTWQAPVVTCEPTSAVTATYDAFVFAAPSTAAMTVDIDTAWNGDGVAHVYFGTFDPAAPAGGTAGGLCLGAAKPGAPLTKLALQAGARFTLVASPTAMTEGAAYSMRVTPTN